MTASRCGAICILLERSKTAVPILIGVHGGGWERGDRKSFRNWGHYLPQHGYGLFAIQYRLAKPAAPAYAGPPLREYFTAR
jgi:acetyl esterase/lipase